MSSTLVQSQPTEPQSKALHTAFRELRTLSAAGHHPHRRLRYRRQRGELAVPRAAVPHIPDLRAVDDGDGTVRSEFHASDSSFAPGQES